MHGWIILDKPEGISSTGALNKIKKYVKPYKIGHAGTLDPFATGVLVIAIGEATKLIDYAMDTSKAYEFTIKWGESTDTLDYTGKVVVTSHVTPSIEAIEACIQSFGTGQYVMQSPPQFSAIHINGERAYDLARSGEQFDIPARSVWLKKLQLISHSSSETQLYLECGKGFYVRSLARDIAANLGACGHVSVLRRTLVGKFTQHDTIKLDYLLQLLHNAERPSSFSDFLHPLQAVLDDILVVPVNGGEAKALRNGQKVYYDKKVINFQKNDRFIVVNQDDGKIVAICNFAESYIIPCRVFNF